MEGTWSVIINVGRCRVPESGGAVGSGVFLDGDLALQFHETRAKDTGSLCWASCGGRESSSDLRGIPRAWILHVSALLSPQKLQI